MPLTLKSDAGMNNDIRNYWSPRQSAGTENNHPNPTHVTPPAAEATTLPATATRSVRRRVMFTSSSSDDDMPQSNNIGPVPTPESITTATLEHDALAAQGTMPQTHMMVANPTPPSITTATPEHLACAAPNVVTVDSSDSESDDMWVRPRAVQQHHASQQDPSRHQQVPPQSPMQIVGVPEQSRDAVHRRSAAGEAQSPGTGQRLPASPRKRCGRQAQSPRQQPTPAPNRTRAQRRRLEAVASESSGSDDSSACSESDEDAQQLYRDAIRGVRNARQARTQVRTATQHCVVCSTFAKYLANFL
jgi:hypothetical protein